MRSLGTSDRLLSGYRVLIFIRKECSEFNVIDKSVYGDRDQPRGRRDEMGMEEDVGSSYLYLHLYLRTSLS